MQLRKDDASASALLHTTDKEARSVTPGVVAALLVAQAFYGGWSVVTRSWIIQGDGVGCMVFLVYRCLLGGAALFLCAWCFEGESCRPPAGVAASSILALGALLAVASLAFLFAVANIGSFLPALGATLIPVYVCAVCAALCLEPVRRWKVLGITFAVAGAVLVVAREEEGSHKTSANHHHELVLLVIDHVSSLWAERPTALTLGFAACACHITMSGNYWMLKKHLLLKSSPLHLSAYAYAVSAVLAFAAALCLGHEHIFVLTWQPSTKNCYALLFSLCECTLGCGLAAWATKRTKATMVAASMTLQPVFSALISRIVLGSTLQADHVAGTLMTSAGLLLVVWSQIVEDGDGHPNLRKATSAKFVV